MQPFIIMFDEVSVDFKNFIEATFQPPGRLAPAQAGLIGSIVTFAWLVTELLCLCLAEMYFHFSTNIIIFGRD